MDSTPHRLRAKKIKNGKFCHLVMRQITMIVTMLYFLTYNFDYKMQIDNKYFVAYFYQFETMNERIYEMIDLSVINHKTC